MKMSNNPAKYEVLIKQYLRSILDITVKHEELRIGQALALLHVVRTNPIL